VTGAPTLLAFTIRNDWGQTSIVAWRALTHNISGSIAVGSAIAVAMLGSFAFRDVQASPAIREWVVREVNFDNVNFITNTQLKEVLSRTSATPAEVAKGTLIFADARLRALKTTIMILAALSTLAIVPAGRMPGFQTGDIPVGYPPTTTWTSTRTTCSTPSRAWPKWSSRPDRAWSARRPSPG
jgi:hypothetical protein